MLSKRIKPTALQIIALTMLPGLSGALAPGDLSDWIEEEPTAIDVDYIFYDDDGYFGYPPHGDEIRDSLEIRLYWPNETDPFYVFPQDGHFPVRSDDYYAPPSLSQAEPGDPYDYEVLVNGFPVQYGYSTCNLRIYSPIDGLEDEQLLPKLAFPIDGDEHDMHRSQSEVYEEKDLSAFSINLYLANSTNEPFVVFPIEIIEDLPSRSATIVIEYLPGSNRTGTEVFTFDNALWGNNPHPLCCSVGQSYRIYSGSFTNTVHYTPSWRDTEFDLGEPQLEGPIRVTVGVDGLTSATTTLTMTRDTFSTWDAVLTPTEDDADNLRLESNAVMGFNRRQEMTNVNGFLLF